MGELMINPVTAADGFSYERANMEKWFAQGRSKVLSPKTLIPMRSVLLVANENLRLQIRNYESPQVQVQQQVQQLLLAEREAAAAAAAAAAEARPAKRQR